MDVTQYAMELVSIPSVSSVSNERISRVIADHLRRMGFEVEWLTYKDVNGERKVNLIAKRGEGSGGVAYLSHSDVVPADDWSLDFCGAFRPIVQDERLWGRGSCDMKGSIACALAAIERISIADQTSPIYFICTADEELGTMGAHQVDTDSKFFAEMVEQEVFGIVGEPTELGVVHAHKGGVGITVSARGKSAHSSLATGINANYALIPILPLLLEIQKESESSLEYRSDTFNPPTLSWNMILRNVPEAINVTPSLAQACIFLRPMPHVDHQPLVDRVQRAAEALGLEFDYVDKTPPFWVPKDASCVRFMETITGNTDAHTVCYATDGGVLRRLKNLVVCGPGSIDQAHRNNEWISLEQLHRGVDVYERAFREWDSWKATGKISDRQTIPSVKTSAEPSSNWQLEVRAASDDDLMEVQSFLQTFVNQNKVLRRSRAELRTLLANGFIATVEHKMVGFCAIEIYSRKLGEIQCLAVDERYQGRGIGTALVQKCVERGREKGILEIMAISSSEGFLRKLGFDYSLPDQKRALFCQLRSREEMYTHAEE